MRFVSSLRSEINDAACRHTDAAHYPGQGGGFVAPQREYALRVLDSQVFIPAISNKSRIPRESQRDYNLAEVFHGQPK
jgi:hypothetical protein